MTRQVPLWQALMAVLISFGLALGLTFAYIHKIDSEWCELLTEMNTAYNTPTDQPLTERGERIAKAIRHLHQEKC